MVWIMPDRRSPTAVTSPGEQGPSDERKQGLCQADLMSMPKINARKRRRTLQVLPSLCSPSQPVCTVTLIFPHSSNNRKVVLFTSPRGGGLKC